MKEPDLQQQRALMVKPVPFERFYFIDQLLSHVCSNINDYPQGSLLSFQSIIPIVFEMFVISLVLNASGPAICFESKTLILVF